MTIRNPSTKIHNEVVFAGNNVVCCMLGKRQRFFGGHQPSRLFVAFLLINIPGLIFHAVIVPRINKVMSGPFNYIMLYGVILEVVSTFLMLVTGFTDPGVIPKNYFDGKAYDQIHPKFKKLQNNGGRKVFYLQQ